MADITYEQINGTLGSLLRLWAAIERETQQAIGKNAKAAGPSARGIAANLNAWEASVLATADPGSLRAALARRLRAQLQPHLAVRNGLCHGLIGTMAGRGGGDAALTWELDGARNSITWDELQASFKWLSRVPQVISMLSRMTVAGPGSRLQGTAEDLQWWSDEFGIVAQPAAR